MLDIVHHIDDIYLYVYKYAVVTFALSSKLFTANSFLLFNVIFCKYRFSAAIGDKYSYLEACGST